MLSAFTSTHLAYAKHDKLVVHLLDENTSHLFTIDCKASITAIGLSKKYIICCLFGGFISKYNLLDASVEEIDNLDGNATCCTVNGDFCYVGTETGLVRVYHIVDSAKDDALLNFDESEAFQQEKNSVKMIKEKRHSAPIRFVQNYGSEFLIFDMKGKMISESGEAYDITPTHVVTKKHVFIAEKKVIFCKTEEAIASIIVAKGPVDYFYFNDSGGAIFVHTKLKIKIYNNEFKLVKILEKKKGLYFYDESRNRLVRLRKDDVEYIENVLPEKYLHSVMKEVSFKKENIKKVVLYDEEIDYDERTTNLIEDGQKKKSKKKSGPKFCDLEAESDGKDEVESVEEAAPKEYYNYENDDDMQEIPTYVSEERNVEYRKVKPKKLKRFISGHVKFEDSALLCYNKHGFVTQCLEWIEVTYHDFTNPKRKFKQKCTHAHVTNSGIALSDEETLFYYGLVTWNLKCANIQFLGATQKFVVAIFDKHAHFYDFLGNLHSKIYMKKLLSIQCDDNLVLFYTKAGIIIVNNNFECYSIGNICKPDFIAIEEEKIYFCIKKQLYMFYRGILFAANALEHKPLCVFNGHIICLKGGLFPSPNVIYTKIKLEGKINENTCLENSLFKEQYLLQENIIHTKPIDPVAVEQLTKQIHDSDLDDLTFDNLPDNQNNTITASKQSVNIGDTNQEFLMTSATTKRFNPLAKKPKK